MWEQLKRRSSYQALPTVEPKKDLYRELHHPVFQSIRVFQVCKSRLASYHASPSLARFKNEYPLFQIENGKHTYTQTQTIVSVSKLITPQAMQQCLKFIYTGAIDRECLDLQVSTKRCSHASMIHTKPMRFHHLTSEIFAFIRIYCL